MDAPLSDQINKKTDNAHFFKLAASELISKYSYLTHIHGVSEKTVQNCFGQNFVKFPSFAIVFGR